MHSIIKSIIVFAVCWGSLCQVKLAAQVLSTKEYIDAYKFAAMQEMKIYGIPASITLGQGILESASGNSKLAKECNNHFGIKCRKDWTGTFCLADDDAANECFRGYSSAMESYRDHSLFLKNGSRYNSLFTLTSTDYKGWANGLRQAGYATNPAYANILIGIIDKYRLGMYDSMVLLGVDYISPDTAAQNIIQLNGLPAVYAKAGQSQKEIASEHNLGTWQIRKYNDLKRGEKLDPGEIVYLKPKRSKGPVAEIKVSEGQDMREISQLYGIKLKKLYSKNKLKSGQQVKPGEILYLQKKRSTAPETISVVGEKPKTVELPQTPVVPEKINADYHEVQTGETLFSIAAKHGVTVEELIKWNNLASNSIKPGQMLILKSSLKSSNADSIGSKQSAISKTIQYHIVVSGETLYTIAKMYNQPLDSIIVWNNLAGKGIRPGQEVIVATPYQAKSKPNETPKLYSVQPGDTLYSIARKFGLRVDNLRRLNNLENDKIRVGQSLVLQ